VAKPTLGDINNPSFAGGRVTESWRHSTGAIESASGAAAAFAIFNALDDLRRATMQGVAVLREGRCVLLSDTSPPAGGRASEHSEAFAAATCTRHQAAHRRYRRSAWKTPKERGRSITRDSLTGQYSAIV
jgi:hypothetical protein